MIGSSRSRTVRGFQSTAGNNIRPAERRGRDRKGVAHALPRSAIEFRVVALATLLVLAGCTTPFEVGGPDQATAPNETTDPESGTPSPADTATSVNTAGPWRNITDHVADALEYWEYNDAAYGGYEIDYDLEPNASDPDIVVRYVEDFSACGPPGRDHVVGFAPRITAENPPDPPERICVRAGFNDESARHVIKHEFGHLLGIRHGEPPVDLMSPDPTLRATSAARENLSVYVDRSMIFARRNQVAKQQLGYVHEYYKTGASGTMGEVNISAVEKRDTADVVVTFPRQSRCDRSKVGSCATFESRPDGKLQLSVAIPATHEDTFGWHAGFWFGYALGIDRHRDLPPPFRNASFDDRRGEWWTDQR